MRIVIESLLFMASFVEQTFSHFTLFQITILSQMAHLNEAKLSERTNWFRLPPLARRSGLYECTGTTLVHAAGKVCVGRHSCIGFVIINPTA